MSALAFERCLILGDLLSPWLQLSLQRMWQFLKYFVQPVNHLAGQAFIPELGYKEMKELTL